MTDALGNTYNTILGPFDRTGFRHYIVVAEDSPPGMNTLTIMIDGPASIQIYAHEYAGLARSSSVDATAMSNP